MRRNMHDRDGRVGTRVLTGVPQVRGTVNRLVDAATKAHRIATALEVSVHIYVPASAGTVGDSGALAPLHAAHEELADLFGVSEVHLHAPSAEAAAWAGLSAPVALHDAVCGPLHLQVRLERHGLCAALRWPQRACFRCCPCARVGPLGRLLARITAHTRMKSAAALRWALRLRA